MDMMDASMDVASNRSLTWTLFSKPSSAEKFSKRTEILEKSTIIPTPTT